MTALNESEIKILDAAKKVFEVKGFSGARMQEIADEAGISKASLHYYFRNKENLFERIFEETMADFMLLVSTWDDDGPDWETKLRQFTREFFTFLKTKSLLFILGEINRNPDLLSHKRKSKTKARFITYFENLVETKQVRKTNVNAFYIYIHSLCAYPILNARLFQRTTGMNQHEFDEFMDAYPDMVAETLINILKKGNSSQS